MFRFPSYVTQNMLDFISPRDLVSDLKDLQRPRLVASAHISEGIWKTYVLYFCLHKFPPQKQSKIQFDSIRHQARIKSYAILPGLPSASRRKVLKVDHDRHLTVK